jgi:hypothetical protein
VPKFVCTTLRPSQLVYTELYDLDGTAQFVADFLSYEPLEDPLVGIGGEAGHELGRFRVGLGRRGTRPQKRRAGGCVLILNASLSASLLIH